MEKEYMVKNREKSSDSKTADKCPELLNALNVSVICCLLDENLTFLWGNTCFFSRIGYSSEEYFNLFHDLHQYYAEYTQDYASLKQSLSHTIQNGSSTIELTVRLPLKAGDFTWTRLSGTVMDNGGEEPPMLQAVFTDVNELYDAMEGQSRLYKQNLQYFKWMMEDYAGNVYISDMDNYELLYLNQTSCDTLRAPLGMLLGHKCYEVIQGRSSPCPFCTNDLLKEDEFYEWEFFNPTLNRTFMIKNRIINWNGHRARIELSHDMYSAEYKLAQKDREREALLRTIPGGIIRLDARDMRTILWYGSNFLEIIGYTKEQFEYELGFQCSYIHPGDTAHMTALLQEVKRSGQNTVAEVRIITHDGDTKNLTITLSYVGVKESWDGIPSFYSLAIDVTRERTEQARQRKALEDAYELARVSNAAKTNFLSSMSHDIRTPMNAIMGMAAIAQANLAVPEKVHDCLDKINVSSRHLLSLINEILDMSKIESGKIDLISEVVALPELLQNVMDMCQPLIAQKHQELQISAVQVRHENVITDGGRIQQVFMNLLSNAVKYTPDGGIISLKVQELPSIIKSKGQYEFVFTDNGVGISDAFMPHIFEPFSRAEDSRISKIQGTGLGLAITENIVRMMNGTIEVRSELGAGTQFIVSVPLTLCLEEEACDTNLAGLPVLVVDDDQIVCESAAALLNELGMRGYWVLSGAEAVHLVIDAHEKNDDFFAVVLDWKMPGMNGMETVKKIRKTLGREVPIIIISAYDYSDIEEEFRRAGADAFITKPLFKSKMLHVLQLFCHNKNADAPAIQPKEQCSSLMGKRILLVEDNDLNREIAIELLLMRGILVDAVEDGKQAVDRFLASPPGSYDCILMDIQMPVMNGYKATETIRALNREDAQTIPILALTANAFATDLGKALSVGMNDHIAKPIDLEHLNEVLNRWIG